MARTSFFALTPARSSREMAPKGCPTTGRTRRPKADLQGRYMTIAVSLPAADKTEWWCKMLGDLMPDWDIMSLFSRKT